MRRFPWMCLAAGLLGVVTNGRVFAQVRTSLPPAVARVGVSLGLESPTAPIRGTVWLPMHDQATLDSAVAALYAKGSPTYHRWMTSTELDRFRPTAAEQGAVAAELAAHDLRVVAQDEAHGWIEFEGVEQDFESAFHTQLGRYQVGTKTIRAALREPSLTGAAAGLVAAVNGIDEVELHPFHSVPRDRAGARLGVTAAAAGPPPGSAQCVFAGATLPLSSTSATASYSGAGYAASLASAGTRAGCGYSPQTVQQMYGLPGVYAKGITGKGQTIVLIDAYGSPTIASDLATFSANYGLAQPSFTGLRVYRPAPVTGSNTSWAEETTLDTEWAHAIAPGANIAIVEAVGQKDSELQTALDYAVRHKLGTIISCSFGGPESEATPATLNKWNQILEMAAAQGIAVQIASGDSGDYAAELGYTDVSAPADSPYATAVGGTSMAYLPDNSTLVQTGWGTNVTALEVGGKLLDPTKNSAFYYGSGGGSSKFFAKPAYQAQLAGTKRLLPDVSALADPFTGAEVLYTQRGQPEYFVVGGTSLAAPLFSAMYALLAQSTGETLGQAAPYVAAGSPLLVDVTAPSTADNPTGELTTSAGTTRYSTTDLSQPEAGTTGFAALLWKVSAEDLYNVSFGTDTSLEVTPGWDNVTGFGTLNFAP